MTIDEIRMLALNLSPEERELLGVELLCTLSSDEDREESDAAWGEEILARSEAYRGGRVQTLDAVGTVERLRQQLAARHAS